MIIKRYQLHFTAPLHLSSGGFGLESVDTFIHSDTLYSAVAMMAVDLLGKTSVKPYFFETNSPAIALSSAFPWCDEVFFFPRPLQLHPILESTQREDRKAWKKVKFISEAFLPNALQTGTMSLEGVNMTTNLASDCLSHKKLRHFFDVIELPRVVLDRVSNNANIFHFSQVTFEENAGLFFLAQFSNEKAQQIFETCLYALGDEGIGGERSSGKGLFEVASIADYSKPQISDANGRLNLSLYIPTEHELSKIDFEQSVYKTLTRRGWVSRHTLRRKTRRPLAEGSALYLNDRSIELSGELEKIFATGEEGLEHDVFRSWQALTLPMKIAHLDHKKKEV